MVTIITPVVMSWRYCLTMEDTIEQHSLTLRTVVNCSLHCSTAYWLHPYHRKSSAVGYPMNERAPHVTGNLRCKDPSRHSLPPIELLQHYLQVTVLNHTYLPWIDFPAFSTNKPDTIYKNSLIMGTWHIRKNLGQMTRYKSQVK